MTTRAIYHLIVVWIFCVGCNMGNKNTSDETTPSSYSAERNRMVAYQIRARGIDDTKIIDAFLEVERHRFVPRRYVRNAYEDRPLPIGEDQTISQPYIVAFMTHALKLSRTDKVLEIGTGSGRCNHRAAPACSVPLARMGSPGAIHP